MTDLLKVVYNNYQRRIFLQVVLVLLLLISCKKAASPEPAPTHDGCGCKIEEDCFEIKPLEGYTIGWEYKYDSIQNQRPCFNPNNPNEIVFVREFFTHEQLIIYNLETKTKSVIYEGRVFYQPKWSVTGWIIFSGPKNQLWKIKDDGTQLTQVTFKNRNYYPEWSPDGAQIAFGKQIDTVINGQITSLSLGVIADQEGTIIERLDHTKGLSFNEGCSWGKQNTIFISAYSDSILFYNADTKAKKILQWRYCANNFGLGIGRWVNNETILANDYKKGLFRIDINTGSHTCIAKNCDSRYYIFMDYSQQSNKIIAECGVKSNVDYNKGTMSFRSVLYLMDADGNNKQLVEIK